MTETRNPMTEAALHSAFEGIRTDLQIAMSGAEMVMMHSNDDDDRIAARRALAALRRVKFNLKEVSTMLNLQTSANGEEL